MKHSIIILLGLISYMVSFGQGSNNTKKELVFIQAEKEIKFNKASELNIARYGFGYTSDSKFIYISNGGSIVFPFQNSIERYDHSTQTWEILDVELKQKRYGSMELIDDKLFIFNGSTSNSKNDLMEVYDLIDNKLEVKKGSPYPVSYAGSATYNGEIYSFGGKSGKIYSNRLYKYDPKSDSWTKLAKMKEKKQTQGEIINGKLYTIGGYNGKSSNKIHEYDIETDTWTHLPIYP